MCFYFRTRRSEKFPSLSLTQVTVLFSFSAVPRWIGLAAHAVRRKLMRKRLPNIFVFLLATTYIAALAQAPEAEWSYSGANGPENWANLSRTYHDCS